MASVLVPRARIWKPFRKPRNRFPAWQNRFLGPLNVCKFGPKYPSSCLLVKCCPIFLNLIFEPLVLLASSNYKCFVFFSSAFRVWSSSLDLRVKTHGFLVSLFPYAYLFSPFSLWISLYCIACPLVLRPRSLVLVLCCPFLLVETIQISFPHPLRKKRSISGCNYFS